MFICRGLFSFSFYCGEKIIKQLNIMSTSIEFTRVKNDTMGNPRYVTHFLNFVSSIEMEQIREDVRTFNASKATGDNYKSATNEAYEIAIKRAKKIGGKRYNTKEYGGGIVFQSYNIKETEKDILELLNS